ncbi:MAG: hypothetical protein H5U26_11720 [Immundisolibacter sp.]|uniref:hypothetical protein n=1 Tax=Immundisolibacter sp. TaxID=1934948 RepID=UPI0019BFA270|nr:hypothetical protein [Immundisolibacter sp.]MBC7162758.1 hypothetical protein [Immundisolibacter sp.]
MDTLQQISLVIPPSSSGLKEPANTSIVYVKCSHSIFLSFLDMMPKMFIGTPVGEILAMMLLGLISALPFLEAHMTKRSRVNSMEFMRKAVPTDAKLAGACA